MVHTPLARMPNASALRGHSQAHDVPAAARLAVMDDAIITGIFTIAGIVVGSALAAIGGVDRGASRGAGHKRATFSSRS